MRAFEVHLNGKKLCVAGIGYGDLLFAIGCGENRLGRGDVGLNVNGRPLANANELHRWQLRTLQMNDQVRIKIVEAKTVDRPEVIQEDPREAIRNTKDYVRQMAKQFGWTIQTGARKPQAR